jgi:hypothetical protein
MLCLVSNCPQYVCYVLFCVAVYELIFLCVWKVGLPQDNTARVDRLLRLSKTAMLAVPTPKTPLSQMGAVAVTSV